MKPQPWQWLKDARLGGLAAAGARFAGRLRALLEISTPEDEHLFRRISRMERDIILPLKVAGIAMLLYSFYGGRWIDNVLNELDIAVEFTTSFFWLYIGVNVLVAGVLLNIRRLPLAVIQWMVFVVCLLDGLFLSALTLVTGGYQSFLYWLFLGLIVRGAVSVPRATSQLALNLTIIACFVLAGVINISIATSLLEHFRASATMLRPPHHAVANREAFVPQPETPGTGAPPATARPENAAPTAVGGDRPPGVAEAELGNLDEAFKESLGLAGPLAHPAESLLLRLLLLLLMTVCCYGVQVLLERHRQAEEEAREFALREGQLHSAGRLAAEFAHRIKNPLAIINNAVFSLERALREGKAGAVEQLRIIQEEVERSDRIITQIMGYAQLSEGRVEKLNVTEELDQAVAQVFPAGADYPVRIQKDYGPEFPPLLMQRRHVAETFVNLLQNAREALDGQPGTIMVRAHCARDYSIEVSIEDSGPGIPADKREQIFEPYYTTKEKGTGLGLASVKHNVELYGGQVRVESELGKGARFVVSFPARTLVRLEKQS